MRSLSGKVAVVTGGGSGIGLATATRLAGAGVSVAIVDLDGGGCVKGNLVDMVPSAEAIKFDMPVNVVFRDAGRKDKDGNSYLAYFFTPAS